MPTLQQIGSDLPWPAAHGAAGFVGSGPATSILLVMGGGKAFLYPATLSAWERHACAVAGRNLTQAEWNYYAPGRPYDRTCPGV